MSKKKQKDDLKEASFNMKKYFKTPEDITEVGFKSYRDKRLKSVFKKGVANAPFLYITNFKFKGNKGEEEHPMIFIGDVNGFWKKAINTDYKRRKEFAQGLCTLKKEEDGSKKLIFDVRKGKGKRDVNLRMINKKLLKKFKITAEYAAGQADAEENGQGDIAAVGEEVVAQTTSVFGRIKQEIARLQKMSPDDLEQQVHQIALINALISEWDLTYKKHKSERKDEAKQIKKLKAYLKKAAKTYNVSNLNAQKLNSFKDDLKSYLISRNEFLSNVKTHQQEGTEQDQLKKLWSELQILKSNIADWKVTNPKPSNEEIKTISQIDTRIKMEEKDLKKWLKKAGIDYKSIDDYQHKMDKRQAEDARQLAILSSMTNLPKISKPALASSTFKKMYKAYQQYDTINGEDIEMRKVKLLEITAYVNQWKKEYEAKNKLKKKFAKKEKKEVDKIEKDLLVFLNAINEFTQERDNYVDIMSAHRDFQKLTVNYEPTEEKEDQLAYLMDNITFMIGEWQMHYTNLSSFGTKKKNKKLETIRQELVDFVKQQGENKQVDDTSAIVDQLTKEKAAANKQELTKLEQEEREAFYKNEDNKQQLEAINKQKEELQKQAEKLQGRKDAEGLIALSGVQFQQRALDNQLLALERPINEAVASKREELNQALIDDKKGLIQQIVVSVATQLTESADNGEFSAQLFDVRDQLKALIRLIKKNKNAESAKAKQMLKEAKQKAKKLQKQEQTLQAKAAKEAFPKISALAKKLAEDLAKKHQLSTEQFQEVLRKLEDHTTYITNNLDKKAQKLCKDTANGILNDPHFDLENINADVKTKLTYDYDNDKELQAIGKETASIKKIKATKAKKRAEHLKDWFKMTGIWESKIGDYYPSPALDKAIKEFERYREELRPIKEEQKHIEALSDLEKQIKVYSANQKKLKEQAADAEKKLVKAKPEKKAALIEKINQKKNAFIETTLKLKGLSDDWEKHYDQIADPDFAKKKASRQEKIHTGVVSFDKQLKELNDKGKISQKHQLAEQIQAKYKATDFQYNADDNEVLADAKQDNINDLLDMITEWESISVVLLDDDELKQQGEDADQVKTMRDALLQEQYRFDNKVKIYKDPVYATIQKQVAKLNIDEIVKGKDVDSTKVNANVIKQLYGLEKIITTWKKAHPASDANFIKQYEYLAELEPKIESIKLSPSGGRSVEQQEFLLRKDDLIARFKEYQVINKKADAVLAFDKKDLEKLKDVLEKGIKHAEELLAVPKSAHKRLDKVAAEFSTFEKEMLKNIHEEKQKEEAKILSILEGCDSYDNIKDILPEEKQAKIEQARDRAVQRAKMIITSGGSATEAERMLEHIPIAFWPDEFLEEMRLWRKAEKLYFQQKGEEAQKEFIDSGLKEFIMDVKEAVTTPKSVYDEVLKSGKYKLDVVQADGTTKKMEFNVLDASHEEEVNPDGTPMKGTKIATNALGTAMDAKSAIMDIKKIIDGRKDDDPEAIRKRQVMIGRVVASTTQKICNNATKYINTTAEGVDGPKIAIAVLKSVSMLSDLILKSTDGLDDPALAKEHFKQVFSKENAGAIVDTLLSVGAGVSEIVGLFNSMGNVVGAAFGVAVNVKELIESAQRLHAAVQAKNEMKSVQDRAVQQDNIMLHAIRREMTTCKEDVAKEAVNVTGDSLRVVGSATGAVGGVVALGHPAAGAGINVGGKIIEKTGDVIKIGGKIVFAIRDNQTKKRVKKLIKKAQTDRNARLELLENSKFFAKAFLAVGLEEEDPIAMHYCLTKGLTEDDLDHEATAQSVLEKLIADDPSTLDEKTIGDKIQDLGHNIKNLVTRYSELDKAQLDFTKVEQLRPTVQTLIKNYKTLGKVSTGTTITSLILTVLTGGTTALITELGDEALANHIEDCAIQMKKLYGFLLVQEGNQDLNIESMITRIETLNQEIEQTDDTDEMLEKVEEVAEHEENIRLKKLFIQETRECKKLFDEAGLKLNV